MKQSSKEYAMALFSLAGESRAEKVYLDALDQVGTVFRACPEYLDLLETPTIEKSERKAALVEAFGGNLPEYLLSFLQILTEKNEIRSIFDCIEDYRTLYNEMAGILVAEVTSARVLTDAEKTRLTAALQKRTGKTVRLVCRHDPTLIGGMVVEIDGMRFDASLRHRISEVKEVMQE